MIDIYYIKEVLGRIIEEAEDPDYPILNDIISLYDEIDEDGGVLLDE